MTETTKDVLRRMRMLVGDAPDEGWLRIDDSLARAAAGDAHAHAEALAEIRSVAGATATERLFAKRDLVGVVDCALIEVPPRPARALDVNAFVGGE